MKESKVVENAVTESVAVAAPAIAPNLKIVKGVKANFDVTQFKKSGVVVATFQISAGNDVRYTFKAAGASVNEAGDLVFTEDFNPESFTDCSVYIPSLKKSVSVTSDTVFHEVMAKAFYNAYKEGFADEVKAKKEKEGATTGKGD